MFCFENSSKYPNQHIITKKSLIINFLASTKLLLAATNHRFKTKIILNNSFFFFQSTKWTQPLSKFEHTHKFSRSTILKPKNKQEKKEEKTRQTQFAGLERTAFPFPFFVFKLLLYHL